MCINILYLKTYLSMQIFWLINLAMSNHTYYTEMMKYSKYRGRISNTRVDEMMKDFTKIPFKSMLSYFFLIFITALEKSFTDGVWDEKFSREFVFLRQNDSKEIIVR